MCSLSLSFKIEKRCSILSNGIEKLRSENAQSIPIMSSDTLSLCIKLLEEIQRHFRAHGYLHTYAKLFWTNVRNEGR